MSELTLSVEHTINAPIEFVFNAWLDPAIMAKFMTPGPGMTVSNVSTEPQVGGRFALTMNADEEQMDHKGEYLAIERYSKLVFTWVSQFSVDGSTVTLDLVEKGEATQINLTQVKFLNEELRDNHIGGWAAILECLNTALAAK